MKPFSILAFLFLVQFVSAETASDISKRFAADKAKALADYVQANPKATDLENALIMLADCYAETGNNERQLSVLQQQYEAMPKGAAGDLRSAAANLAKRIRLITDKKAAGAAIDTVKKDFASHKEISQAAKFFDSIGAKLSLPGVGDTLTIAFTALDGRKVDLASMKDKVVLVDFWATWCGPCVGELPNVKKAFTAYHDKGFEIIGISLDQSDAELKAFVEKNEMTWPQYFDGKGWENVLSRKYGIQSIPATFLIGKDGKIAATDLRGDALETKLAELLK